MAKRTLQVEITGDSRSLERAVGRSEKSLGKLGTAAKTAGLGLAAGLGAGAAYAVKEARDAQKVGKQTDAVLKSTGKAAGVSAKQIEGLANSISLKTGKDDEAIQSAENLLLTFTKVRNETGKGNQVFSSATKVITDMSVSLKQDLKSSTIQVGKALNDPVKGITALTRVGVTFDAKTKDQIKTLVEHGDTLKAQKIILKELNKEFGGSAAAQADSMDRAKVAVDNLAEALGTYLLPAVETVAGGLASFVTGIQDGTGAGGKFASAMSTYAKVIKAEWGGIASVVRSAVDWMPTGFGAAKNAVVSAVGTIKSTLGISTGDLVRFGQAARNVGLVVAAAALGIGRVWKAIFETVILPVAKRVFPGVIQVVQGALRVIGGIFKTFGAVLTGDWGKAWSSIKQIASGQIKIVGGIIRAASAPWRAAAALAIRGIIGVWRGAIGGIKSAATAAIGGAVSGIKAGGGKIVSAARGYVEAIPAIYAALGTKMFNAGKSIVSAIVRGIKSSPGAVVDAIKSLVPGPVRGALKKLKGGAGDLFGSVFQGGGVAGLGFGVLSPGELGITPSGQSFMVPGQRVAADTVPMSMPVGTAIFTGDGQRRLAMGESPASALRRQAPHFAKGGVVGGTYDSTSYGPPWSGGNGTGVTRTGVNLKGSPHVYGVAVDPSVIPLGTSLSISPNPFHTRKPFKAFDTGRAIKGHRLDFYDWRGRGKQMGWGHRSVKVSKAGSGGSSTKGSVTIPAARSYPLLGNQLSPLIDNAFGFEGSRTELLTQILEGIVPEGSDYATRKTFDVASASGGKGASGKGGTAVAAMVGRASAIDKHHYPYVWGGGHSTFRGPYDCSGAVSAVLHSGGQLNQPMVSGALASWGQPGRGKHVTVYANPTHAFMSLNGRGFGTGQSNPGGGAGWLPYNSRPGFSVRHPKGMRRGGYVGGIPPSVLQRRRVQAELARPDGLLPGMRRGGKPKRLSTIIRRLSGSPGNRGADVLTRSLAGRVKGRSEKALLRSRRNIRSRLRKMLSHGLTGSERIKSRRLKGALSLVDYQLGRPVARALAGSDQAQAEIERETTNLDSALLLAGIDPESEEGVRRHQALTRGSIDYLATHRSGLVAARAKAKRAGQTGAVAKIDQEIAEVDDQMLQLRASLVKLGEQVDNNAEALKNAMEALTAELKKQNEFQNAVTAVTSREAVKALADVISGQIGATAGSRGQTAGTGNLYAVGRI